MSKGIGKFVATGVGIALVIAGLYCIKTDVHLVGMSEIVPYVFVGLGCGLFGDGMGKMISNDGLDEDTKKQLDIEINDERNVAISNKAKAKAYDLMTYVEGAMIVSFGIMGIETRYLILMVFAYVLVKAYAVYYRIKLEKEM